MTNQEFMSEFWQVIITRVRDQALVILLLLAGLWWTVNQVTDMKKEAKEAQSDFDAKIMACHKEREALALRVAVLEAVANMPPSHRPD